MTILKKTILCYSIDPLFVSTYTKCQYVTVSKYMSKDKRKVVSMPLYKSYSSDRTSILCLCYDYF